MSSVLKMKLSKTMVFKLFSIITMFIRQTTLYSEVANSYLPPERAQVPPEVCYCEVERGRERKREREVVLYLVQFYIYYIYYLYNFVQFPAHIQ